MDIRYISKEESIKQTDTDRKSNSQSEEDDDDRQTVTQTGRSRSSRKSLYLERDTCKQTDR